MPSLPAFPPFSLSQLRKGSKPPKPYVSLSVRGVSYKTKVRTWRKKGALLFWVNGEATMKLPSLFLLCSKETSSSRIKLSGKCLSLHVCTCARCWLAGASCDATDSLRAEQFSNLWNKIGFIISWWTVLKHSHEWEVEGWFNQHWNWNKNICLILCKGGRKPNSSLQDFLFLKKLQWLLLLRYLWRLP